MKIKKRILTFVLAMSMLIQTIIPTASFAKESSSYQKENMVKVGTLDASNLMPLNGRTMQQINRLTKNAQDGQPIEKGTQLFSKPWFPEQRDPEDKDKPLYFGKVYVNLKTKGLTQQDGTELPFDWESVLGRDEYGELNKVKVVFLQLNYKEGSFSTETGIKGILETDTEGKHYWADENGDPIKLPLYSKDFKPYKYEAYIERSNSERVNLILDGSFGTPDFTFTKPDPKTGEIVADVFMDNTLIQIASTKFVSEWNTDTIEDDRPIVEFSYNTHYIGDEGEEIEGYFKFPKNNKDIEIIRDDNREDGKYSSSLLEKVPTVDVADPDPESNDTYTLDRDNNRISYKGKTYNYTFNYDVINGGKFTMTEILDLKFDANGGKFDSIDEGKDQVKEYEVIYNNDLSETIEEPKKDYETFIGWGIKDDNGEFIKDKRGNILLVDDTFKNVKKSQTYYAIWDKHPISVDQLEVKESFKDGDTWVNNFIPTLDKLKEQVKIKDGSGTPQPLAGTDTFEILKADGQTAFTQVEIDDGTLKNYLYEKLQEKTNPNDEPTRVETVKAKVTHKNGTSQTVDIPIKVIKNIYEAKTLTEKPYYVPNGYVKVTLDPTKKAIDSQRTYYYVNPEAQVVIPGEDPVGTGDNKFVKWTMKADESTGEDSEYKLADKPRIQFEKASTITAQYVSDVIPANDDGSKPDTVPANFVEVKFVPTDKAKDTTEKIFYVNSNKDVTIPIKDPEAKATYTFKEWKIGVNADGDVYTPSNARQFTEAITVITATYEEGTNIIPFDPKAENPMVRPDGYVKLTFDADLGLKLTESKAFYVKKNANVKLSQLVKPKYDQAKGYAFDGWDKADNTVINEDMVVTAKAKESSSPAPSPDPSPSPTPTPDSSPSYPRVVHRDRIVEKEKIVEKIVRVGESQLFKEVRYMQGFDGYFRPNDGLTRAEAAQILANALVEDGYKYNPNFKISYKDIGEAWYTRAVKIVTEAKVFAGYDDGNFKPQAKITRNEWIATLKRFQELGSASGNNMKLRDDHWAKAEIQAAFNEGWLKIYTDGLATYKGDEFIPRQEVAAVSNKAFKRIVDKTYIGKNNLSLVNYKDVNTSMWAYEDILCASNTFLDRKDRYIAHWYKEDKNQFNIDTSSFEIVQKNFQRNPR